MCWCEPCMATQHIKWQLIKMRGEKKNMKPKMNSYYRDESSAKRTIFFFSLFVFSVRVMLLARRERCHKPHIVPTIRCLIWCEFFESNKTETELMIFYLENTLFFLLSTLLLGCATFRLNGSIHFSACGLHWIRFSENIFDFEKSAYWRTSYSRNRLYFAHINSILESSSGCGANARSRKIHAVPCDAWTDVVRVELVGPWIRD